MAERANIFDEDLDLSGFTPRKSHNPNLRPRPFVRFRKR